MGALLGERSSLLTAEEGGRVGCRRREGQKLLVGHDSH